ncbi:MAG: DUF6265 family protein [Bacteroidia bacterium]
MKKNNLAVMLILISTLCSFAQAEIKIPAELFSLSGTWFMDVKGGTLYETWQQTDSSSLSGSGFKVDEKGDTSVTESILLTVKENKVVYVPSVTDQNEGKPVSFALVKSKKKIFVFENKAHDFPQTIIYDLSQPGKLNVIIEGKTNEGFRSIPFNFTRK